ncbi:DUF4339 domain-containing protein [Saccharibacter floricola]|uniref:DUF4339 domain-containing protein n=1 Tax=Saccharibacter floricola TaxID=231053 RepID=UPI00036F7D63|nr:DUF4339 domain-containing protein [Saccharibacter floricola]
MEWFYEQNGQQVGPVSRTEVIRLIVQRRIQPHTLVWTPDFGDQWRPAIKAGLMVSLSGRFRHNNAAESDEQGDNHTAALPSLWAWIYLIVPNGLALLIQYIAYTKGTIETPLLPVLFVYAISFIALMMDRRILQASAVQPPSVWWYFFFPGYFIMRRERLGRGRVLAACAVLVFALKVAASLSLSWPILEKMVHTNMTQMQQGTHAPQQQKVPSQPPASSQPHTDDGKDPSSENDTTI